MLFRSRSTRLGKNSSETFAVTAGGEAVYKALEHTMHAVKAVVIDTFRSV